MTTDDIDVISIDEECHAPAWWTAARSAADCPPALRPLIMGAVDAVALHRRDAARAIGWARRLPGWSSGPASAPYPLQVR